jgi:hypothetical protein
VIFDSRFRKVWCNLFRYFQVSKIYILLNMKLAYMDEFRFNRRTGLRAGMAWMLFAAGRITGLVSAEEPRENVSIVDVGSRDLKSIIDHTQGDGNIAELMRWGERSVVIDVGDHRFPEDYHKFGKMFARAIAYSETGIVMNDIELENYVSHGSRTVSTYKGGCTLSLTDLESFVTAAAQRANMEHMSILNRHELELVATIAKLCEEYRHTDTHSELYDPAAEVAVIGLSNNLHRYEHFDFGTTPRVGVVLHEACHKAILTSRAINGYSSELGAKDQFWRYKKEENPDQVEFLRMIFGDSYDMVEATVELWTYEALMGAGADTMKRLWWHVEECIRYEEGERRVGEFQQKNPGMISVALKQAPIFSSYARELWGYEADIDGDKVAIHTLLPAEIVNFK